ncbi:hypothetical protein AOC36_04755 [Erysipelothrix larvae]|uniref:NodB homology domain-containing protein n=1 Tax=Erysipelothrix larvae TaxID=1514105 RepID=A0A0X8GZJ3_9FIRM|nr:polysaccharide deacetylase family protein [Erysipelothrix larvae]AMC93307.1 hypothetical protein AOC36_04755 [Erysipelothrix larvae]
MKKRKIRRWVVYALVFVLVGGLTYAGIWFYNAVSIQFPENMLNVEQTNKNFGSQKTIKDKTSSYFIVQHYPHTGVEPLDQWIKESTDAIREQVKKEVLINAIVKEGEKPYEFLQDYASEILDGNFISIKMTAYLNNQIYNTESKVFDKRLNRFSSVNDFFKPLALRRLTNEARESIDMGEMSRMDFLSKVSLLTGTENIFIKGTTFTFTFSDSLSFTKDMAENENYLLLNLGDLKSNDSPVYPTYVAQGVDPQSKLIALTFDDGPHMELTAQIMDILEKYDAHATFFVMGSRVEGREEILVDMLNRGHQLANHSWNHPNFTKLKPEEALEQVINTENALIKATGYEGPYFVRPPYGAINPGLRELIDRVFINWTVDSEDWLSKDADAICKHIDYAAFDGSIVLMHDIHESTAQSLECVLSSLKEDGYTFVTVRELLEARGQGPNSGQLYREAVK